MTCSIQEQKENETEEQGKKTTHPKRVLHIFKKNFDFPDIFKRSVVDKHILGAERGEK